MENFGEVNARSQVNTKSNYVDTGLTNREEFTSGAFSIVSELSVDNTVLKLLQDLFCREPGNSAL